jgi:glycosyltransferase involved in cell wall biosynthesis
MPKVSIIVPVYNVETYLSECLDSLLNQTLNDIEILCVNDGSTDSSPKILEHYTQKDARIKVFSKPNSGYGHTMNVGLDNARGEYIGIVESDDFVPSEMYKELYEKAIQNDLDFIKADFYRFTKENGELNLEYNALAKGNTAYYNRVLDPAEHVEVFKFIMNTWSGIYKRDFIEKFHIRHNETPGASFQDNGFFFQTFCQAKRIMFLNKPYYMNRRDNPNSSVKSKEKVFCIRDEYDFIYNFLLSHPELKQRYIYIYSLKKFHNYIFTYQRIADEFKIMFLEHFSETFQLAMSKNELDRSLFTNYEWRTLNEIIADPHHYYEQQKKLQPTKQPHKKNIFFNTVNYYRDNGFTQTIRHIVKKIIKKS